MNKTAGFTVAAAAGLVLALAGCGPHHSGKLKSDLASASANPAASVAAGVIQNCVEKDAPSLKAIDTCIFPSGTTVKVKTCILTKGAADMSAGKAKVEQDIANCVASNG